MALSQAIELTQQSSPCGSGRESENVKILEQKRSHLKHQMQNELSLRDRALLSHASIVQSLYEEAHARLQHIPADLLLRLPNIFISDAFEQDAKAIFKAGEVLDLAKQSPVAMLADIARIAPSFAAQDAVFVAMHHATMVSAGEKTQFPYFLVHFNQIKWLFQQFSCNEGSSLPLLMSKPKFVECMTRMCSTIAPENKLVQLYDALADTGEMAFHHFCCAFLHSEEYEPANEVQSISVFGGDDNLLHLGGSIQDSAAIEYIDNRSCQVLPILPHACSRLSCPQCVTVASQVSTPSLTQVRSLQDSLSSPSRLRLKMKAVTFFESAMHLHQYTSLKHRNAPPPSPAPLDASGRGSPEGPALSFGDFLRLAPDDLRSYHSPNIGWSVSLGSPNGLRTSDC
jgi:hypothetical protein